MFNIIGKSKSILWWLIVGESSSSKRKGEVCGYGCEIYQNLQKEEVVLLIKRVPNKMQLVFFFPNTNLTSSRLPLQFGTEEYTER